MSALQVGVRRRRGCRQWMPFGGGAATVFVLSLPACGGSATTSPTSGASTPASAPTSATAHGTSSTASPTSAPALVTSTASPECPTAATAGGALGISLPPPVGVTGPPTASLPAGATEINCEYHTSTYNVLIQVLTNVDPSSISMFSSNFPVPYQTVSGVGDQARSFVQSIGGGRDNEAVVATKGTTLVAITATATPASLAQIESLVKQLL